MRIGGILLVAASVGLAIWGFLFNTSLEPASFMVADYVVPMTHRIANVDLLNWRTAIFVGAGALFAAGVALIAAGEAVIALRRRAP